MSLDIDKIWSIFKTYVHDKKKLIEYGWMLVNDSNADPFDLYHSNYIIALDMCNLDDDAFLRFHNLYHEKTAEEVIKEINFYVKHNSLDANRASRIINLWYKEKGYETIASIDAQIDVLTHVIDDLKAQKVKLLND